MNGGGYRTPEIVVVPQPQITRTASDLDWERIVEWLSSPATDGIIQGSSRVVAEGLDNWNAPSSIVKTKVIANLTNSYTHN